ncbi:OmpA family protein [Candidatus Methylobacter oryzae]|uniref:OmpA family protein n=1 Tax=Candidatus Methylobacter oryzae TaxID=2497749 RepID=A0ABY3CB99_9GAMM|nr:OmpA family protein [Candidatus Methylobacter oryzae]TRW96353.1 OmpA family protein [Candidatus Methylobacter oryzae]
MRKISKDPFLKLQSSLSLEDLLAQPSTRNSQNWLLTYLDVFVLIVMLVITLITVSDINTQHQQITAEQQRTAKANKAKTPASACPPSVIVKNEPAQQAPASEHNTENTNTKNDSSESKSIISGLTNTPEIKTTTEATQSPPTPTNPTNNQQSAINLTEEDKLPQQLMKAIDELGLSKTVNIKVDHGYAQLEIQDQVLFKSSEADLTASGGALLKHLMPLLKQSTGLILIEGHTDNIPIKTSQFRSNWELGASRATSVLHFLILQQLDSNRLRAITYADTMPIADNSTQEGREKNRRVNILIKLSEQ